MCECGVSVDHSTIYRWVQKYAPEIEKRLGWQWRVPLSTSWRVDETYLKVRGQWAYLYRAVDKHGNIIEFYLSPTRNTSAAKRFLGKALSSLKDWEKPTAINTEKAPAYAGALAELKSEDKRPKETLHRQVKYLNNIIEADHGKLKQLIRPVRGFKTLKTAYATIRGFEVMRQTSDIQHTVFARPGSPTAGTHYSDRRCRCRRIDAGRICMVLLQRSLARAAGLHKRLSSVRSRGDLEQTCDEATLSPDVVSTDISNLPLSDHRHRLKTRQCSSGRPEPSKPERRTSQSLNTPVILLENVVEVFNLAQP